MYSASRPTTPFIPPLNGASPAGQPAVIPPSPVGLSPVVPPRPVEGYGYPTPPWYAGAVPPMPPGTPWVAPYLGAPHPAARGRRNSYHGMPPPGGPPFDAGAYFGYPAEPQQFLGPNYAPPPAAAPPQPEPVIPPRPRSHSRGSNNGFSADWIGPTRPGEQFNPAVLPVPAEFADRVPPGTPFYAPIGTPYAGYYPYTPQSRPASRGHQRHRSHSRSQFGTPWVGWGYLPPEADEFPDHFDRAMRPERGSGMIDTRWFSGKDYGPVLDPLLAGITKCTFKINPILSPPPEDPTKRVHLTWNMLFSSAYAHRSDERATQSWMKGRDAPATFPRLTALRLISRGFTWFIDVKAHSKSKGVTCGDVVEAVSAFLLERTGAREYNALPRVDQTRVSAAYHHNRSMSDDVPGGRLGEGLRRCDFLGEDTMWGGLEINQVYVAERMQISGRAKREANNVFVLNCEKRLPMTVEERREQATRGRTASRAPSASE